MNEIVSESVRDRRSPMFPRAMALCMAAAVLCAGCGGGSKKHSVAQASQPSSACGAAESGAPVGLVLGLRANSPKPVLPGDFADQVTALITAAAKAKPAAPVVVTELDGVPHLAYDEPFATTAKGSIGIKTERDQYVSYVNTVASSLKPSQPQADDLMAIRKTTDQMKHRGTLIVADSGLQTSAPLDFRTPGLLEATPAEIATSLSNSGELPDLHGIRVVFVGVGQTVTPQPDIGQPLITNLKHIWQTLLVKAGACDVSFEPDASLADSSTAGYPAVGLVPLPAPPKPGPFCGTTVFADSGTVGFEPDTTQFRDPAAAHTTLANYAATVKPYLPGATIEVVGTTATWGDEAGRLKLSAERAQAVVDELVTLGIPRANLKPEGVGTHWSTHVDDVTKNGLNPVLAEQNRSVVLVGHCGGSAS
ncbi:hypothetical protein Caci_6944 [Catenulispora acidiphila DSM 44928]|uniref:OmpA-like domain-containing protein n=1 Tax=Catenulispora acidiphila (strain DSM 44928 / JCM 14897 / NBRC 102108 / NRRL B-24433 / ID139908) TaxID=479433 RepID=C7Q3L0_CATAD|nr:OmpA family protein [Catenulispora acidiphila]ACU75775.1 hypothetical protein Caci_6944 [Catenulispora acidiphila DSM 44928]